MWSPHEQRPIGLEVVDFSKKVTAGYNKMLFIELLFHVLAYASE